MNGSEAGLGYVDDARRYRLDSRIATGGMGEVWRGTDTVLGREVAVKVLKREYADDSLFRSRFETEARHAASLSHPGVAGVYDFGEAAATDGSGVPRPYLVMELVDGQPLSALLQGGRPLDPAAVRDLLAQVGDALGAAHAAGIVHRDVKPANLLVTPRREVKVTDFGIARAAEGIGLTQTGQVMGTPQYLSPEQARGNPATPASDVYSLGVVAFECLAGHRPFQADSPVATALAHLHDPVPELPASVPADLAAVVRRAMAKEPGERFADGAAFAAALRDPATAVVAMPPTAAAMVAPPPAEHTQVLTGVGAPVDPTPTPAQGAAPAAPERGRNWWPVLLVVLLLIAIAVGAFAVSRGGDDDEPTDRPTPTQGAETVRVDASAYEGRPLDEVVEELKDLGLKVSTDEVANPGDEIPGLVSAVNPTGRLQEGDQVTVSYWGEVPEEEPTETPTEPTEEPTEPEPSETPSETPSESPTPTGEPTETPTEAPSTPAATDGAGTDGEGVVPSGEAAADGSATSLDTGERSEREDVRR
ncbi:serine/threonine-protein kinase [Nocardioides ferulae]|uniref:serine/threonine-protein kinase n=1 Tax=Nocardioides ferulae TaxID=2340821 RepID=UPI001980497D|nr:serine/threonine-protein kinase [Nocardioides ferulae]